MKTIVKVIYGSRLYGASVPSSDFDYKSVYLPYLEELIDERGKVHNYKDESGPIKIEHEAFDFRYFIELLLSGQVIANDMIWTPPFMWEEVTDEWLEFIKLRDRLVSKNIMPFVGYARGQALKYGEKGDRLRTVLDFEAAFKSMEDSSDRLLISDSLPLNPIFFDELENSFKDRDGVKIKVETKQGTTIRMIEVVGKSFGNSTARKLWREPLAKLVKSFGRRSSESMLTDGLDVKACYHCVRIIEEGLELLQHRRITFPRPEADVLLAIRRGDMSKTEVESHISERFKVLEEALKNSTLPEKPPMADEARAFVKKAILNNIENVQTNYTYERNLC